MKRAMPVAVERIRQNIQYILTERLIPRQLVLVLADAVFVNVAFVVAIMLRFDFRLPAAMMAKYVDLAAALTAAYIVVYGLFGLYSSLWHYAGASELIRVTLAVTVAGVASFAVVAAYAVVGFPRSILILAWLLNILFAGGIRMSYRVGRRLHFGVRQLAVRTAFSGSAKRSEADEETSASAEDVKGNDDGSGKRNGNGNGKAVLKKALIVGAGDAGDMVARELSKHPEMGRYPIGFVDDSPEKQHMRLHGIPVLGTRHDIPRLVATHGVSEIVIAIPSGNRQTIREIVDICRSTKAELRILPGVYELIGGHVTVNQIREVRIEDLLGREPVRVDVTEIASYLRGERVLVTGAGGSIGSELCRQIARFEPAQLLLLGHGENSIYNIHLELKEKHPNLNLVPIIADIQDEKRIDAVFKLYKPSVVFHAAAHKHVPLMEANPGEAIKNNVFGTKNVAEAADKYGAKRFVLISTDKAVNPTSVMGATKRLAELIIQSLSRQSKTKYVAVRFGNVLGSRGSVVPLFQRQIARGGPVTVTHPDMKRYFMTIPEAVQLVIQAGAMGKGGEVFVLDMGEPVRIVDLAYDMIRLSGFRPNVDIAVEFIGVRPGEKLFEELLTAEEGTEATKHERIYTARRKYVNDMQLAKALHSLSELASHSDDRSGTMMSEAVRKAVAMAYGHSKTLFAAVGAETLDSIEQPAAYVGGYLTDGMSGLNEVK